MDAVNLPDDGLPDPTDTLSYDDAVAYEDQIPADSNDAEKASLAKRIGNTKVYIPSETSITRAGKSYILCSARSLWNGKRKLIEVEEAYENEDDIMDEDTMNRGNALLLQGPPIAHLPTALLFAYAKHFDALPVALEWIDDTTCVLVFPSKASALQAHRYLQKNSSEQPDVSGYVVAKPIPVTLWPPEKRISISLGKGEGVKGTIMMRWALFDDVKKKGARKESAFYKKHGRPGGIESYEGESVPSAEKRWRDDDAPSDELRKAQLDDELDQFLAEDKSDDPPSPPSKMRSDYIAEDGRTLLERTSVIRLLSDTEERPTLADRLTAPLPKRARKELGTMYSSRPEDLASYVSSAKLDWGPSTESKSKSRQNERPSRRGQPRSDKQPRYKQRKMTQQELDDDIDAFLNERE